MGEALVVVFLGGSCTRILRMGETVDHRVSILVPPPIFPIPPTQPTLLNANKLIISAKVLVRGVTSLG